MVNFRVNIDDCLARKVLQTTKKIVNFFIKKIHLYIRRLRTKAKNNKKSALYAH